jgi:hypothetical protein
MSFTIIISQFTVSIAAKAAGILSGDSLFNVPVVHIRFTIIISQFTVSIAAKAAAIASDTLCSHSRHPSAVLPCTSLSLLLSK